MWITRSTTRSGQRLISTIYTRANQYRVRTGTYTASTPGGGAGNDSPDERDGGGTVPLSAIARIEQRFGLRSPSII